MKAREISPVGVRMPPELRDKVAEAAAANNRSLSAEIVARVEKSFEAADEWAQALKDINEAFERIEQLEIHVRDLQYQAGIKDY